MGKGSAPATTTTTTKKKKEAIDSSFASREYPPWHNSVAGAAAGAGARLFTAPLDLLKIRRQLGPAPSTPPVNIVNNGAIAPAASSKTSGGLFSSLFNIMKAEGGIQSLFRGNLAATYLWIGYAAVQFAVYGTASNFLTGYAATSNTLEVEPPVARTGIDRIAHDVLLSIGNSPVGVAFCSGAAAGVCATAATYPLDICRTTFAARGMMAEIAHKAAPPETFLGYAKTMYQTQGIRGFYAGCGPAICQIIPYMGINFALYDYIVRFSDRTNVGNAGIAGSIAGGTSKIIVYPLDTVKKRIQAQTFGGLGMMAGGRKAAERVCTSVASSSGNAAPMYDSMANCITNIIKEEGVQAFYRGLVPSVLKTMTGTGLTFAFFTLTKNTLESVHDKRYGSKERLQLAQD